MRTCGGDLDRPPAEFLTDHIREIRAAVGGLDIGIRWLKQQPGAADEVDQAPQRVGGLDRDAGHEAGLARVYGARILSWLESDLFQDVVLCFIVVAVALTVLSLVQVIRATRAKKPVMADG